MTLTMHTNPPRFIPRVEPPPMEKEDDYCLEEKAVELISDLKYALDTEPETRYQFASFLINESLRIAISDGRKIAGVDDVLRAYDRIYDC